MSCSSTHKRTNKQILANCTVFYSLNNMFFFHIKCVIISFTLKQLAWHFISTSSRIIFVSESIGFWQYVQISLSKIFLQKQWCECEYSVTEEVRICKVQLNYWNFRVTYKLFQQFLMCRCLRDLQVCGEVMPLKCKFHILYLGKILHLIKHSTSHCTCCQCKLCRFLWSSYDRHIHNCKKKKNPQIQVSAIFHQHTVWYLNLVKWNIPAIHWGHSLHRFGDHCIRNIVFRPVQIIQIHCKISVDLKWPCRYRSRSANAYLLSL